MSTATEKSNISSNTSQEIEWHYAPVAGLLSKRINGEWENGGGWAKHHQNMEEFLRLRVTGNLVLKETTEYGSVLFYGHHGRVAVYVPKCP